MLETFRYQRTINLTNNAQTGLGQFKIKKLELINSIPELERELELKDFVQN